MFEMHAIIKGQVQGVGFRATTRYYALKLNITGTVCNLGDGSVEIYAQGPKQKLEELLKNLQEEAFPGQIQEAKVDYYPVKIAVANFRIVPPPNSLNKN